MRRTRRWTIALGFCLAGASTAWGAGQPFAVDTYHGAPDRSGHFVVPSLTPERARAMRPDPNFRAHFSGHVYAQPLYWQDAKSGAGRLLVVTEDNTVYALDAKTGAPLWNRMLARPVMRSALQCGDIDPLGITGTPVIDTRRGAAYLAAASQEQDGVHHRVFGLSLADGSVLPGWPVDVAATLEAQSKSFVARDQNQRGALVILGNAVYVPYGGHFGDCGRYHGWVIGLSLDDPRRATSWSTRGAGGGIWAPGGIASDGHSLFVATGNTLNAARWSDGEAVFRLAPDLHASYGTQDFFAAKDWQALDERDEDLGGSNPVLIDLPSPQGTLPLLLAPGKDRRAYLINRDNLGGMGGSVLAETVTNGSIRTAPAAYPALDGVLVALQGEGTACPTRRRDNDLVVLKIRAGAPPAMSTAWCGALSGRGSPIVTTTDGRSNPIVWIVGAEGDNRLHGFDGLTGEPLFGGAESGGEMAGLHRFQTLVATPDRLYVAADGRIYAFAF